MPKRIVFFFIGFVVLASLVYYGFNQLKDSREEVDLWTLVPEDAVLVVETNNHTALVEHLRETELWDNFSMLPAARHFEENIAYLDSAAAGNQRLERFLDKKDILTSIHVEGKNDIQFAYYIPISTVGEHRFYRTFIESISKSSAFTEETHDYKGFLLTDITNTRLGTTFTYFSYHNNVIVSPSPVLIEEIVRRINRAKLTSIATGFEKTNYLDQPDVYANVFVNYRALPDLFELFVRDELMPQVRYLASLCQNGKLELKLEQDKIFMNGFSNPERLKDSFHSNIAPVKPQPLLIRNYLPIRTAVMMHFGLDEVTRLRQEAQAEGTAYGTILDSLSQTFSNEVALAYMEAYNITSSPDKIVYAHLGNVDLAGTLLSRLGEHLSDARKKSAFTEQYGSYTIQLLDVPELPAQLFGKLFSGFDQSYIVQVDDYLIFAPDISTLRALLDDISDENVWGKSVAQKAFLEETLQEANFSLFINTVNAWYVLSRSVTDDDREELLQNALLIKRFNQVSLQFAKVEKQYYTSLVIRKQERSSTSRESRFTVGLTLSFGNLLYSRPLPIQNAVDRSKEIVVQDSVNVLFNITANGSLGWVDSVGSKVRGTIKQIEYGPDKKLRHVFVTENRIHAIDNQGRSLDNFPFNLPDSVNVQHLAAFDYNKDGDYRLLVDDNLGNLYMYDILGTAIPGWQPRRMDYRLAAKPQHLSVGGQDVILVLLENGYVYALNRNGETYPGFPFSLKSPVTSGAFAKLGSDLKRSEITAVTKYGAVVVFNLQGKVLQREQLIRPSKSAMFNLVPESSNGRSFIIARQDQGRVVLFDQDLKEVLDKRYVTSAPKIVQYYHFGGDKKVFAITETGPQKTYLYNSKATLIGDRTLESNQPVTIYYNEVANNYSLYKVYGRELTKLEFKLPE
ncbi:hypothetical protein ACFSKU_12955 [Pontibacter silvestris]|uniref:DUF3352 domain-containing protein n=1 Tax=Pontibacter silvestris TaxID=2305183 RepID=A0ABW4WZX9_9BACT|nr:hypothetical protein [Pontibacter silvestris]MCC9135644.1 hypothetical protein [Pontibacter silvestris]